MSGLGRTTQPVRGGGRMRLSPLCLRGLAMAALVIAVDQATKWWILHEVMAPPRVVQLTSFFNLVMTWNRGVSFGMFNHDASWNLWLLPLVAVAIAGMLLVWLMRAERPVLALALGAILGGAIGNVVDRLRFGAVADFLDFHFFGYHWPAFNVADAAISVGVTVLIVESLFGRAEARTKDAGFGRDSKK